MKKKKQQQHHSWFVGPDEDRGETSHFPHRLAHCIYCKRIDKEQRREQNKSFSPPLNIEDTHAQTHEEKKKKRKVNGQKET